MWKEYEVDYQRGNSVIKFLNDLNNKGIKPEHIMITNTLIADTIYYFEERK